MINRIVIRATAGQCRTLLDFLNRATATGYREAQALLELHHLISAAKPEEEPSAETKEKTEGR